MDLLLNRWRFCRSILIARFSADTEKRHYSANRGEPHKDDCVLEQIDIIEEYSHPLTASDTFLADRLKEKKKVLRQKLKQQEAKNL